MINGIVNIYKEKGYTSHDVVAKLRGILKQKKIGHTGTLDPDAQGVLPVCLGKGTKLCDTLTDKDKIYEVVMLLGTITDTEDTTGTILAQNEVPCEINQVTSVILSFKGDYNQIPPMYSALKVNGKKLYELAREGKVIERKPRPVHIYNIDILDITLPRVKMRISCSKGTYIRSLCRDIGELLGCGGCMEELLRTKVSIFTVDKSYRLDEIAALQEDNNLDSVIQKIDDMFPDYPAVTVAREYDKLIYNGNKFSKEHLVQQENYDDHYKYVRVYDEDGVFIGIYNYKDEDGQFVSYKMFI